MNRPFRARLLAGELLVGTIVTLPVPEVGIDALFLSRAAGDALTELAQASTGAPA